MKKTILSTLFLLGLSVFSFAQTDIRQIDFKNFTFEPFCVGEEAQKITVKDGEFSEEKEADGYTERFYFKVYDLKYADVNGDGQEEAIISSVCNTGGTGNFTNGLIYTIKNGKLTVLTEFEGGDRADGGLVSAKVVDKQLIVERNSPGEFGGSCCPEFIETTRYKWNGKNLVPVGEASSRELYPATRVSFQKGTSMSAFSVRIPQGEIKRYIFGARKGQILLVSTDIKDSSKLSARRRRRKRNCRRHPRQAERKRRLCFRAFK